MHLKGKIKGLKITLRSGQEINFPLDTRIYISGSLARDFEEDWTFGEAVERMLRQGVKEDIIADLTYQLYKFGELVNAFGRIGLWPKDTTPS